MAQVLAFSSYVASGHVGLAAVVPALQRLGHEVIALPSVVLSNHLGHVHWAGRPVALEDLTAMLEALEQNGQFADIDAILTGFLPTPEHVALAAKTVRHVRDRHGDVAYLCDPVFGDEPEGHYIGVPAAQAIASELVPLATYVTPNRFEAKFIFGEGFDDPQKALPKDCRLLAVTSAELAGDQLRTRCVTSDPEAAFACAVPYRPVVPHGTGDLFAALLLGHILNGSSESDAFARAVAGVETVIAASNGRDELAIVAAIDMAAKAKPWPFA